MRKQRKKKKWRKTKYKVRVLKLKQKKDPLGGAPQAKGIVIAKKGIEQKQPHSGIIKCVSPDTNVLLFNGAHLTMEQLESNWKNNQVMTCNLEKQELSKTPLTDYFSISSKQIKAERAFKIVGETGRVLKATSSHPIYTKKGKIDVGKLRIEDEVVVLPIDSENYEITNKTIFSEKDFERELKDDSSKDMIIRQLKEKGLLPLRFDNPNLLIIVKMLGHIFGDGTLSVGKCGKFKQYKVVFSGYPEDIKEIKKDVQKLGFYVSKIIEYKRKSTVIIRGKRHVIDGTSHLAMCTSSVLFKFLKILGAPVGRKSEVLCRIPNWIKKSPRWVKREFLSTYFGSELEKPRTGGRKNSLYSTFQPSCFALSKNEKIINNAFEFVEDVKTILRDFNIKISTVKIKDFTERKDKTKSMQIRVYIASNTDNLINLFGKIGYSYCKKRAVLARYAYQYLLLRRKRLEKWREAYDKTLDLRKKGLSIGKIFKELQRLEYNIKYHNVNYWVCNPIKYKNKVGTTSNRFEKFEDWMKKVSKGLENGLVWEKIIEKIPVQENDFRDITTLSKNHNFFANGFLTGNCVRVQLLKNGKEITAFCPRTGAIDFINEHDEVLVEGLGGSQGGAIGSMWGVRWKVIKVNNLPLSELRKGKVKKVAK